MEGRTDLEDLAVAHELLHGVLRVEAYEDEKMSVRAAGCARSP